MGINIETPPRAWGRPIEIVKQSFVQGNTPTGVGKTDLPYDQILLRQETPPRAWGRRGWMLAGALALGNTPTGVGKTQAMQAALHNSKKHPHGRGEDSGK